MLKKTKNLFLVVFFLICSFLLNSQDSNSKIKLLIKIPTRSRTEQFFKNLDLFYKNLSNQVSYKFLITCDEDDTSMNCPEVITRLKSYPNLDFTFSKNRSKVEAYNKGISYYNFDILLIASDDMIPIVKDYDKIIIEQMEGIFQITMVY